MLPPEAAPPVLEDEPGLSLPDKPLPVAPGLAVPAPGGDDAAGSAVPGMLPVVFPLDMPVDGSPRPALVDPGLEAPD